MASHGAKEKLVLGPDLRKDQPVKWLTVTAMLMALNIAMSSFGVPVPGGHLYLNDAVICTAAILLDPLGAFFVGGGVHAAVLQGGAADLLGQVFSALSEF